MKPSENEKQSGTKKGCVTISPLLIQRSRLTLKVKIYRIILLYMYAQVCGIHASILVSIHEHIQGEAAMAVSLFTKRSSSHMVLHLRHSPRRTFYDTLIRPIASTGQRRRTGNGNVATWTCCCANHHTSAVRHCGMRAPMRRSTTRPGRVGS
jgi:hypothetical protein